MYVMYVHMYVMWCDMINDMCVCVCVYTYAMYHIVFTWMQERSFSLKFGAQICEIFLNLHMKHWARPCEADQGLHRQNFMDAKCKFLTLRWNKGLGQRNTLSMFRIPSFYTADQHKIKYSSS